MKNYYHSPMRWDGLKPSESIFLAGSITGAVDWQESIKDLLLPHFNVFNPRRPDFDVAITEMEQQQIRWEWAALDFCHYHLFWFSHETLAPITLFEYGKSLVLHRYCDKRLIVGTHTDYKRKNDVLIQSSLEGFNHISHSLDELVESAIALKKLNDKTFV